MKGVLVYCSASFMTKNSDGNISFSTLFHTYILTLFLDNTQDICRLTLHFGTICIKFSILLAKCFLKTKCDMMEKIKNGHDGLNTCHDEFPLSDMSGNKCGQRKTFTNFIKSLSTKNYLKTIKRNRHFYRISKAIWRKFSD